MSTVKKPKKKATAIRRPAPLSEIEVDAAWQANQINGDIVQSNLDGTLLLQSTLEQVVILDRMIDQLSDIRKGIEKMILGHIDAGMPIESGKIAVTVKETSRVTLKWKEMWEKAILELGRDPKIQEESAKDAAFPSVSRKVNIVVGK